MTPNEMAGTALIGALFAWIYWLIRDARRDHREIVELQGKCERLLSNLVAIQDQKTGEPEMTNEDSKFVFSISAEVNSETGLFKEFNLFFRENTEEEHIHHQAMRFGINDEGLCWIEILAPVRMSVLLKLVADYEGENIESKMLAEAFVKASVPVGLIIEETKP